MKSLAVPALSVFIGLFFINVIDISAQNQFTTTAIANFTNASDIEETATAIPMVELVGEEVNGTEEFPHIVVYNRFDEPCLLANINATLRISYRVRPEAVQETYIAISDISLPDHTEADIIGECGRGHDAITLNYDWDNSTFQVVMTFSLQELTPEMEAENETAVWTLSDLQIHFDLSNEEAFPGAKESNVVSVSRHGLSLFETPEDHTMLCEREIRVQVGEDEPGVDLIFNNVEIAAFGVVSEEFPEAFVECQDKSFMRPDDDIVVPLIVACSLSLVVVLVVVAYAISRKIQEARDQSQYKPMP